MSTCKTAIAALLFSGTFLSQAAAGGAGATAAGSLDKSIIRRVIQQHIAEVKRCYETELEKKKDLAGRVMVHFIIGTDGKVTESSISETTLNSPAGERCIADAVKGWAFPAPRGGTVTVTYPFVLASSGTGESEPVKEPQKPAR